MSTVIYVNSRLRTGLQRIGYDFHSVDMEFILHESILADKDTDDTEPAAAPPTAENASALLYPAVILFGPESCIRCYYGGNRRQ